MKQLFISSDDFGMSHSVNEGIRLACNKGVLSSTNLMVPCPWFEHAAFLTPNMDCEIGIHLTLTSEWRFYRWRPLIGNTSLTDDNGYLFRSIQELMENANLADIKSECRAQIEAVLKKKIKLAYIDLHMCIPSISGVMKNADYEIDLMNIVSDIAKEYRLPYSYELNENHKLRYFDSGLSISSKEYSAVELWLSQLGSGIHHLSCHCAVDSAEQSNLAHIEDYNYDWALTFRRADTRLLLSDWFSNIIDKHKIHIVKNLFTQSPATIQTEPL